MSLPNPQRDHLLLQQTEAIAKTGSWELDLATNELYWSEGVYRMLDMEPRPGIVDVNLAVGVIHPDDQASALEAMNLALSTNAGYEIRKRFVTATGAIRQIRSVAVVIRNDQGAPTKLVGVFHDMTDLLETQQRLSESEALLTEAQRMSQMGSWNFDFRTDKLTWSEALYDVFGADRDTFKETHGSFLSLIIPEDRDRTQAISKQSQETGEPFKIRYRILTPTGELRHIEEHGNSEKDAEGNILRLFGTAQNITERFKEEHRFRSLVENGADAVVIFDADGRSAYVSPSITKVLGYTEKEALDLNLFEIIHPDDVAGVSECMREAKEHPGVPTHGHISRTKHKDGSWRWLDATLTNLLGDPYIKGIVDNFRDVTDAIITSKLEQLERVMMEKSIQEDADLDLILKEYLLGIERVFPGLHCAIMTVREGRLYTRIAPSLPKSMNDMFDGQRMGPAAGSCGTTAYKGKPVIVSDIANDPLWKNYRTQALDHGFMACWSQPVFDSKGNVMATFANYYPMVKSPSKKELELFTRSASLIGLIIESQNRLRAVVESNERFEYAMKATTDAIYDWDVVSDRFTWGDGFHRLFGYPKPLDAYSLADWVAMTHPEDDAAHAQRWIEFFADPSQNHWTNSFRFRRSNGRYAHVEENGYLIRDADGKPMRMIGVIRDMTEQHYKTLQQSVQRDLSALFNTSDGLDVTLRSALAHLVDLGRFETGEIWLKNVDSSVLSLKSFVAASDKSKPYHQETLQIGRFMLGQGLPGTVWETNFREVWNDVDTNDRFLRKSSALASGMKSAVAIPLRHNEGLVGVMMFTSAKTLKIDSLRFDILNPLETFLGAEIKRKQQESELHNFFNHAPDILAVATPAGHFVNVNPAFCTIMGYTKEDLTSKPFTSFMHPDDVVATKKEFEETITGDRLADGFINRYITKSGDVIWISWNSSDVFGEDGFVFAYGRNVTQMMRLQDLFNSATRLARVGSWDMDLVKNSVYWSSVTRDIHEVEPEYVPTLAESILFYREDVRDVVRKAVADAMEQDQTWDLELPIITMKGNERWIRTIGKPEFVNGVCVRIYGSFQDIHARKTAELDLQASMREKSIILESIGEGFFTVDREFTVTNWNRMAEQYLRTPREQIIGTNLWSRFADATLLPSFVNYRRAMDENVAVHFDDYYEVVDLWFEVSAYPSESGLSVFFKDITSRKKSEQRFQIVTEATNDAIWDFDVANNELFWGKGFQTQFGYDPESEPPDFVRWESRIHPDHKEHVLLTFDAQFRNPLAKNWFQEYRFLKSDGTYATVIDRAVLVRNSEGRVVRVVGAMSDISYRKTYEESLMKLNRKLERHAKDLELSNAELEQFAYVASHDLQEPLRMITGFLSQLEKKYGHKLDAKAKQYIHFAVDGATRMRTIILDLLEFSRVGRIGNEMATFPLKEIVDDYLLLRAKLIEDKNAIIYCSALPTLTTYRTPVTQVMNNLLDNAIKYSKPGVKPEIHIHSKRVNGFWQISIQDNGIGISDEYFDKIFIIFQRLHDKTEYSGSGLGLAIVKKIVDNLGGRIWVDSTEGVGSTFTFTVPDQ